MKKKGKKIDLINTENRAVDEMQNDTASQFPSADLVRST